MSRHTRLLPAALAASHLGRAGMPPSTYPSPASPLRRRPTMAHIRILRRLPLLIGVLALGMLLGLAVSAGSAQRQRHPEPQPHMREALDALRSAEHHLNEATGDKGGHR